MKKAIFKKASDVYPHGSLREQAMNFIEKLQSDSRKELHFHEENLVNWLVDFYESVAVPIVQETEDELWKEMGEDIQRLGIISVADFFTKQKSKFTIQRREPKKWVTSREIGKDGEFHRAKDNQFPIE